jgi:CO/xanthine dehydrogenase Mo-binding subunit
LIVAESYRRAREAVKLVKVTYDVSKAPKPVLSLDDAIARKSFFPPYPGTTPVGPFATGDLGKGFAQSKHVIQVRSVATPPPAACHLLWRRSRGSVVTV